MTNYGSKTLGELDDAYETSRCASVYDSDTHEIVMGWRVNNTELETVAEKLHKVRVMRRGRGLEQFYNMWRTATHDPEFLRTGYYTINGVYPIRARKDNGLVRETPNLLWCWYCGEFWVSVKDRMGEI